MENNSSQGGRERDLSFVDKVIVSHQKRKREREIKHDKALF
jgi:hypothetical protein